jgi:hypothetical protein
MPNNEVNHLSSIQDFFKTWVSQILPIEVEKRDFVIHKVFWSIGKSMF